MIIDYDKAGRRLHTETMGSTQYASPTSESSGPGSAIGQTTYQSLYKYTDTGQIQSISGKAVGHSVNFALTAITANQEVGMVEKDRREYDSQGYWWYKYQLWQSNGTHGLPKASRNA